MTKIRWTVTIIVLSVLAALAIWARHRERLMQACIDEGRAWNGVESRCEAPRIGPILRRALERS